MTKEVPNTRSQTNRTKQEKGDTLTNSKGNEETFYSTPEYWKLTCDLVLQIQQHHIRLLIIPVHVVSHWILCVVFFEIVSLCLVCLMCVYV
jgi:hypothetical protein